jgi:hypothetical protein
MIWFWSSVNAVRSATTSQLNWLATACTWWTLANTKRNEENKDYLLYIRVLTWPGGRRPWPSYGWGPVAPLPFSQLEMYRFKKIICPCSTHLSGKYVGIYAKYPLIKIKLGRKADGSTILLQPTFLCPNRYNCLPRNRFPSNSNQNSVSVPYCFRPQPGVFHNIAHPWQLIGRAIHKLKYFISSPSYGILFIIYAATYFITILSERRATQGWKLPVWHKSEYQKTTSSSRTLRYYSKAYPEHTGVVNCCCIEYNVCFLIIVLRCQQTSVFPRRHQLTYDLHTSVVPSQTYQSICHS